MGSSAAQPLNHTGEKRCPVQIGPDDFVCLLVGVDQIARKLRSPLRSPIGLARQRIGGMGKLTQEIRQQRDSEFASPRVITMDLIC
jgi:ABC-type enterobactin transport system permease subunit